MDRTPLRNHSRSNFVQILHSFLAIQPQEVNNLDSKWIRANLQMILSVALEPDFFVSRTVDELATEKSLAWAGSKEEMCQLLDSL